MQFSSRYGIFWVYHIRFGDGRLHCAAASCKVIGRKVFYHGLFDKLFGGKAEEEETAKFFGQSKTVLTPLRGKVLAQADIPDETFAQGILGPGCGIEPTGKTAYAPFDGTVNQVASTLHAVGLTSEDGIEILIHVGMDTVEMQGKGFKALVKVGDKVKAGTPLLKVDLDAIRAAGHPTATAIIVTNGDDMGELKMLAEGDVLAGTPLFKF